MFTDIAGCLCASAPADMEVLRRGAGGGGGDPSHNHSIIEGKGIQFRVLYPPKRSHIKTKKTLQRKFVCEDKFRVNCRDIDWPNTYDFP